MARKKAPRHSEQVEIIRIRETQTTRRILIITVGIVASIGIIAWAAVRIMERPAWLVFALAVLAALSGPTGLLVLGVRYVKRWTRRHVTRQAQLERQVDPGRTSSNLNPDGTDPSETQP